MGKSSILNFDWPPSCFNQAEYVKNTFYTTFNEEQSPISCVLLAFSETKLKISHFETFLAAMLFKDGRQEL